MRRILARSRSRRVRRTARRLYLCTVAFGISLSAAATAHAAALGSRGAAGTDRAVSNLSGQEKNGGVKQASASFTVPNVTCSGDEPLGIGIGVGDSATPGLPSVSAYVQVDCIEGDPFFYMDAFAGGTFVSSGKVAAGDKIVATITQSNSDVIATLKNRTTDKSIENTGPGTLTKVLWGAFPLLNGTPEPIGVPDFGKASIKGRLNNKALKGTKTVNRKTGSTTQIAASKLQNGKFLLTFKNH